MILDMGTPEPMPGDDEPLFARLYTRPELEEGIERARYQLFYPDGGTKHQATRLFPTTATTTEVLAAFLEEGVPERVIGSVRQVWGPL